MANIHTYKFGRFLYSTLFVLALFQSLKELFIQFIPVSDNLAFSAAERSSINWKDATSVSTGE